MSTDWRSIEDDREKYAAYLCSREWAVLKEAVHKRAREMCERCDSFSMDAVHHLTYERKYQERLEDLAGWCKHCHNFTHGKSNFDPNTSDVRWVGHYVRRLRANGQLPGLVPRSQLAVPYEIQGGLSKPLHEHQFLMNAIDTIRATPTCPKCECLDFGAEYAAEAINTLLPFDYLGCKSTGCFHIDVQTYQFLLKVFGVTEATFEQHECFSDAKGIVDVPQD